MTDPIALPSHRRLIRVQQMARRLQAMIELFNDIDRRRPVPVAFAGEVRRTCAEAAALLGEPASNLKNVVLPVTLIVTVAQLTYAAISLLKNAEQRWRKKNPSSFRRSSAEA